MGCLPHFRFLLAKWDGDGRAEEGSAVMDLLFGKEEQFIEGLGWGGVAERNVDSQVGTDVIIRSPCKWVRLVLRLD